LRYILGSRLRAGLFGRLFSRPESRLFISQLAALTGEDQANVSRELARLEKLGLLISSTEGRNKYYQANRKCPIFPELRGLVLKTVGLADVLRDALAQFENRIRVAFVYGSIASGGDSPESDIDLMIVGDLSLRDLAGPLRRATETLSREINPVIYPAAEFAAKVRGRHHFVADVVGSPKIFLMGDESGLKGITRKGRPRKP